MTFAFDTVVQKFYSQQDAKRGYMIMQGDERAGRRSDFMHTTIGVVTKGLNHYNDSQELFAALKNIHVIANLPSKSNYLIERAKISADSAVLEKIFNKKIAVIEKDEAMTLLLSTILEMQGYEVTVNDNFIETEEVPAVIILDAGDSYEKSGLTLCKDIKNNPKYKDTKLIITSIFHDKELVLDSGADLYLPKPFEIASLVKWIEVFINESNS